MTRATRLPVYAALVLSLAMPLAAGAQEQSGNREQQAQQTQGQQQEARRPQAPARNAQALPPESVTRHSLQLPGRTLSFTATAGHLTLTDQQGSPQAEIGFVAYTRDDADPATRPVTFAVNGGPGASSAYLHLLAIGPWLLPMDGTTISPSAPTALVPNAETWLDFTDLVFIDPPGTGYSRVVGGDQVRDRMYSVQGDIDALAAVVMRWLKEKNRLTSPKFFVGESYGGFRGPLLAQKLQSDQGIGFSGLVLVSPVFDFNWLERGTAGSPWTSAVLLPSLAAARLSRNGTVSRDALKDAEAYASGEYLVDLMRGLQDKEAVDRISRRVAEISGLDPELTRRLAGRIDMRTIQRELRRGSAEVVSAYDTNVAAADPNPTSLSSRFQDPVLDAMTAPLTSAIIHHLTDTLNYKAEGRYNLLNGSVTGAWRWGGGRNGPENLDELRQVLSLDGKLRVLVAHGFTDLVTPYYASQLLLNQLPDLGPEKRVALSVYDGGHMFYSREASRQAFRSDVQRLFEQALQARAAGNGD
ncbi:S10 family peptidase [Microvirga lotononidis]|uniref:Carboxypeptidase C (Cathepsin A) n=1 Tax=Microvirga lotononidis TaxID=864069 RepID=I4YWI6_9HYPH|nr:peptidase S10 [Microvirga lotononidis]EIM28328.1 carboxypeptidase C (cathepsin A) [Microvirga lotononidis]WQO27581.1 peptidase S10 [Microvirga lotononidis]